MKRRYERSKFIEILTETPFISFAARQSSVSRSTIYRWIKDDYDFNQAVQKALTFGRANMIDIAEMALVSKIKKGDVGAIKLYLQNNDPRYMPKRTVFIGPEVSKLKPGKTCEQCGITIPTDITQENLMENLKECADLYERLKEVNKEKEKPTPNE